MTSEALGLQVGTTTPGWDQKLQQGSNPRSMLIHGFIHILLSVPGMSFNNKHVGSEVTAFLFWAGLSVYILVTLALFKRPVWHSGLFLPGLSGVCTLDATQVMWS